MAVLPDLFRHPVFPPLVLPVDLLLEFLFILDVVFTRVLS